MNTSIRQFDAILDALPIAKWGFKEVQLAGALGFVGTGILAWAGWPWCWGAPLPFLAAWLVIWFFRDPHRVTPDKPNVYVSPADGRVVEISRLKQYDFFDGPAVRIGIFLSLWDVHVNRCPADATAVEMHYQPGKHRDARNPRSALENESQWIGWQEPHGQRYAVRQVSGAVARRIVCPLSPGDSLARGERFGMIKFGSRTELIVPAGVEVVVEVGDRVKGGETILAKLQESQQNETR